MSDRIRIEGIELHGFHGVPAAEREVGHRYRVDVTFELDLRAAGETDDFTRTVDYAAAAAAVIEEGTGPSVQLVEALAHRMAQRLLADFPLVGAVELRVAKLKPPTPVLFEAGVVEIRRRRRQ
ncbi:MAG: dihydroneopterin aldolase [Armatimonadota bacterium]